MCFFFNLQTLTQLAYGTESNTGVTEDELPWFVAQMNTVKMVEVGGGGKSKDRWFSMSLRPSQLGQHNKILYLKRKRRNGRGGRERERLGTGQVLQVSYVSQTLERCPLKAY